MAGFDALVLLFSNAGLKKQSSGALIATSGSS
jgi:hypothetical protein